MHAHDCSSALLSHAMAAPPPNLKVAITIHVAFERTVLKYAGLYDDTVTVKSIVDANLAKACESAARSLIFESASTFASAEDMRVGRARSQIRMRRNVCVPVSVYVMCISHVGR